MANPTLQDLDAWESEISETPKKEAKKSITLKDLDAWDKELPSTSQDNESQIPMGMTDQVSQALMHPAHGKRIQEAGKGFAQQALNAPGALVNMIRPDTVPQFNFAPNTQGTEEGKFLFNMLAPAKVGKGLSAIGKLAELVPGLNKLFGGIRKGAEANKLLSGAGQVAKTGTQGAVGGAITNPENPQENALIGGGLGVGLGAGSKLLGAGLSAINPLKTTLSPEQLQQNLRIAGETEVPLGDVIQSPKLKKFTENVLAHIPGSGFQDKLQNLNKTIVNRGQGFIDKLRGGVEPVEIPDRLVGSLKGALKESKRIKNNLYGKLDKLSEQSNFKPSVKNFMQEAKSSRNSIDSIKVLENDPELKALYNKISRYEEPLIEGHEPSLKEATLLKSTLSEYGKAFQSSPDPKDRLAGGTLRRLAAKLDLDIKQSMKKASPELKDAYDKTNKYFKEKHLPNLDSEIYKFTMGKGDPDMLVKSLVRSDRNKLSDKLLSKLSEKDKNLIGYSLLKKAIDPETGAVNPKQLRNALKGLSSYQKEAIFGKNMKNKLNDYSQLVKMSDEALTQMYNPKTGARAMNFFGLGLPYAMGASAGGVPGGIAAATAASGGANLLGSALTSPNMRKYAVNSLSRPNIGLQNKLQNVIGAGSAYGAPAFRNVLATGSE